MWFKILTGKEYKQFKADKARMTLDQNTIAEYKCKIADLERSLAKANEQSAKLLQQKSHVEKIKLEVELDTRKAQKKILQLSKQLRHGEADIQVETIELISAEDCEAIVRRIAGEDIVTRALIVPQDANLAANLLSPPYGKGRL